MRLGEDVSGVLVEIHSRTTVYRVVECNWSVTSKLARLEIGSLIDWPFLPLIRRILAVSSASYLQRSGFRCRIGSKL